MFSARPSLLLLVFCALPFLSVPWNQDKGGGTSEGKSYDAPRKLPSSQSEKSTDRENPALAGVDEYASAEAVMGEESKGEKTGTRRNSGEDLLLSGIKIMREVLKFETTGLVQKKEQRYLEEGVEGLQRGASDWIGLAEEVILRAKQEEVRQGYEEKSERREEKTKRKTKINEGKKNN